MLSIFQSLNAGMTENLTYSHGNLETPFFWNRWKTLPGVEVQLASDGEVLAKACNLKGYFKDPERTLNDLQGSF